MSSNSLLRIGIVGCGHLVRQVHIPALSTIPGVTVAAFADPIANPVAGSSAPIFNTLDQMLASTPLDAVLVASPSGEHARHASLVLNSGKALYLEKPMASTLAEAEALHALAQSSGAIAMMGFNYRFNPLMQHAAAVARQSPITKLHSVFSIAPRPLPAWKVTRATGGGALLDLASHHLDLITAMFGFEVQSIEAKLESRNSEHDTATLTLHSPQGAVANGFYSLADTESDYISFTNASGPHRFSRYDPLSFPLFPPHRFAAYHWERRQSPWKEPSFRRSLAAWIEAIRTNTQPPVTLTDGLRVMRLIHDAEANSA